jgi:hypothetical protein
VRGKRLTNDDITKLALWSDDPAGVDLLSFDAVAATIADALLDPTLDPVALGLSGTWGSEKTTVLGLVAHELRARAQEGQKVLVIPTEPWRYDPTTGAKESLITEVLGAVADEIEATETTIAGAKEKAKELLGKLVRRIDWAKAIKLAAKTSLALQLPSINELVDLVKPAEADGGDDQPPGLEAFRAEFQELMASDALAYVQAVAVLVDDLDRCLPESVIETLEAIRLFLSVPKMSFVIAADEDRVADAIRTRFRDTGIPPEPGEAGEEPAKLYLHKIVQTTVPLPTLSRFDTQAFLLLLQLQATLDKPDFGKVIEECARVRREGGGLDDLSPPNGVDLNIELAFASRLTPILYEKLRGNPRRIKRFLNDLAVRRAIAARRGISLDPAVIAKLMVLEVLLPDEFTKVLEWLAGGTLRDQITRLEHAAGRAISTPARDEDGVSAPDAHAPSPPKPDARTDAEATTFTDGLVRWAKLPPELHNIDLSPYLHLAASFSGVTLLDASLPERLRDIAANLLSSSRADRQAVTDADLDGLSAVDADSLLQHIGRTLRDQPTTQKMGVTAVVRIARRKPDAIPSAKSALLMLPADDITLGTPLLITKDDPAALFEVLRTWHDQVTGQVRAAVENALKQRKPS